MGVGDDTKVSHSEDKKCDTPAVKKREVSRNVCKEELLE